MNLAAILSVACGGALGSVARYLVGIYFGRWFGTGFPWGTLFINVTGSFLIGALAESFALRWNVSLSTKAFLIVGICGGYTTFSAFSLDFATLMVRGASLLALTYVAASVVLAIAALYAGFHVMRGLLGP